MNYKTKKVVFVNLATQTTEVKTLPDLNPYIGGTGLGLKLMEMYYDKNPVILSIGPLNGFFPYASKTSIIVNNEGVIEDLYLGGSLSLRMRFTGIDSLVIMGASNQPVILDIFNTQVNYKDATTKITDLGLPGKRSFIHFVQDKLKLHEYFTFPDNFLEQDFRQRNLQGVCVTGTEIFRPKDFKKYEMLYYKILSRQHELSVDEGYYPSCSNCPRGCGKSQIGELGGNVLIHSLVSCQYADKIYTDLGTIFSCLNSLGYEYTHEDIENLPELIEKTLKNLS